MNIMHEIETASNLIELAFGKFKTNDEEILGALTSLELLKVDNNDIEKVKALLSNFVFDESDSMIPMLKFKVKSVRGLYINIYRAKFCFKDQKLKCDSPEGIAIYHRARLPGRSHAKEVLVGYLHKNIQKTLISHLNMHKLLVKKYNDVSEIPTLRNFLPIYENILRNKNPKTVHKIINLLKGKFEPFLDYRMDLITSGDLIDFVTSQQRSRTAIEIQNNESQFVVKHSTLKEWICTIRVAIEAASVYANLFTPCKTLYCKALKFRGSEIKPRYINDDTLSHLIISLKKRDDSKLKNKNTECMFSDYLTPLMLLLLETGLRPMYALSLKWSDIDFKENIINIRPTQGKIKKHQACKLTNELALVLAEWKKHTIHNRTGNWVFPSPQNNSLHLTSYKTTFTTFRKEYGLDLVMYETRHTFATLITKVYKNLQTTKEALHHADIRTTTRYSSALKEDLIKAADQTSEHNSFFSNYKGGSANVNTASY
ncbi:site-specific integrase [Colwellia sp. MB3u-70]|uniref:tyrosine-type recombinase/integrase n=1 Tax=unclassified Colwellia TaxID=196834 RepID=UPI0015F501B7|nr:MULTISPECIES: site-specific integrase [unclassified Colwellia]MBA6291423.1 site-specific integrase [Colwellia sp. MB3u-8]MBA6305860.1 site-specific integrase [Colwellia sp. MB3u-70]